jgi:hypothetical protein
MQKVTLTIENCRAAYMMLRVLRNTGYVHDIKIDNAFILNEFNTDKFDDDWDGDFYIEDLQMTVHELRTASPTDLYLRRKKKVDEWKGLI